MSSETREALPQCCARQTLAEVTCGLCSGRGRYCACQSCNAVFEQPSTPQPADGGRVTLPATTPYVDRIIRIFRDRPGDDATAMVLLDYARAALAVRQEGG